MAKNETPDVDTAEEGDAPLIDLNDASIKKMMARAEKRQARPSLDKRP